MPPARFTITAEHWERVLGSRMRTFALALGAIFAFSAVAAGGASAATKAMRHHHVSGARNPRTGVVDIDGARTNIQVTVAVDKSQLIHVDRMFKDITVGNKDIADVEPLSQHLLYVLGKKRGSTNISLTDGNRRVVAIIDVAVSYDIQGLQSRIAELVPGERISVRAAGDSIVLSGKVKSADHLRQIVSLAEHFAPGDNAVINMMSIGGSQQVMLRVRFAEVQRSALKQLGVNTDYSLTSGNDLITTATGLGIADTPFGSAIANLINGSYTLDVQIDALEKKGIVRTLAEPNLVALSGDSASFLAGGEIPIPVAQPGGGAGGTGFTTVQYKDFGVGLSFTPTVISNDTINLVMKGEVSSIDPSVSVVTNGISVPGFKVRRSNTTIELKDGQSFAIAGLIQDDFKDGISQIPGLGNLPIIGALMRSTSYQHDQTELVIFITVHLVQPTVAKALMSPTDYVTLPAPMALFGLGQLEGNPVISQAQGGGIDGTYGYILP